MDDAMALNYGWPSQFEQVWPIDAQGPYVVNPDDRLVVMGQNPDGSPLILFDGFAQVPQVDLTPRFQSVNFAAVGTAVRCYDTRISGRIHAQRGHADHRGWFGRRADGPTMPIQSVRQLGRRHGRHPRQRDTDRQLHARRRTRRLPGLHRPAPGRARAVRRPLKIAAILKNHPQYDAARQKADALLAKASALREQIVKIETQ